MGISKKCERIFVYIFVVLKVPEIDRSRDFIRKNAQELCLTPPEGGDTWLQSTSIFHIFCRELQLCRRTPHMYIFTESYENIFGNAQSDESAPSAR